MFLNLGFLLERNVVRVLLALVILMELFATIEAHKRVRVTLPDSIFEPIKG